VCSLAETKYNVIIEWIKSKIIDGTFIPNQKISSEYELMKKFNVSRHTVRVAIKNLVNEGWLYTEQGSGTFCATRNVNRKNGYSEKKIAIVTTYISDYIFPSIIRGAEAEISRAGYQVSLFSTNNNFDEEKRILETIIQQQFDGVIVEPTKSASSNPNLKYYFQLEASGIPYIMINAYYEELNPSCVLMDDEKGSYIQTEHLLKQNHENIAGFFKTDDMQGVKRLKGFIKALRDHEVPVNPLNIITYTTEEKSFRPAAILEEMLENTSNKLTGIVCYNDELAMSLLEVLRQKKINVPDDLSIIGFDNSFFADISEVKLTTIEHPKSKLGRKAARLVLDIISNKKKRFGEMFIFDPVLVERNSTKDLTMVKKI
jgi:GntR family transcriptional regulator, arabinose operon transcriptional repressor